MVTPNKQRGVNLIELVVVLTVLGIALAVGAPALVEVIARNSADAQAKRLASGINFARSQAVNKSQMVSVARVGNTANDWSQGWQVFTDANPADAAQFNAATDVLLRNFDGIAGEYTVRSDAATPTLITFNPKGLRADAGIADRVIALCETDRTTNIPGFRITVNRIGRVTITTIAAADKAAQCL